MAKQQYTEGEAVCAGCLHSRHGTLKCVRKQVQDSSTGGFYIFGVCGLFEPRPPLVIWYPLGKNHGAQ